MKWFHCAYLDRGLYDRQMEMLWRHFGPEHVHPFLFEDLRQDPVSLCQQIFKILGVGSEFIPDTGSRYNVLELVDGLLDVGALVVESGDLLGTPIEIGHVGRIED